MWFYELTSSTVLLSFQVPLKLSIFHAIDQNFVEAVKLILRYDKCDSLQIKLDHPCFQIGMTPLHLAAIKNNYTILKLLLQNGHKLEVSNLVYFLTNI